MVQQSNADFQSSIGKIYGKISIICSLILLIMLIIYGMYLITNPYKPTDKDYKNNIIYTHSRIVGIFIVLLSSFFVYILIQFNHKINTNKELAESMGLIAEIDLLTRRRFL